MDWVDGPWIVAHATITALPTWLKRGTRASFGFLPLRRCDYVGAETEVISNTIVTEVSVLSSTQEPAEPCAEVLLLQRDAPPPAGEVIHHDSPGQTLIRPGSGRVLHVV